MIFMITFFYLKHKHLEEFLYSAKATDPETITETSLFKYTGNFTTKNEKFLIKILIFFHISAQNIDCGTL